MVVAARSMTKYTLFIVVALVATAILSTGAEAGHECWTGSDDECDRFCHEVLGKRAVSAMLVRSFALLCTAASLAMAACTLTYKYTDGTQSSRDVIAEQCYTVAAGIPKDVAVVDVVGASDHGEIETYGKRGCRTLLEKGPTPLTVTKPRIYSVYIALCP
ncbi:hypothetical protein BGZ88_009378 [Linnemannia elongata]|nr:hypothetical protein BGZ88_009378 [Linnemannia elongata]